MNHRSAKIRRTEIVVCALCISACASLEPIPDELDIAAYSCLQHYEPSGDPMKRTTGELAPESSFLTINRSSDGLLWRQALVDEATQTLDIQYFLWRTDDTGALLLNHVIDAAERGVHVRLLMDDFDSVGWNHRALGLNTHPNIEIRVFNPFKKRRDGWHSRAYELLSDLDRLNHRMHNKLMLADNHVAIAGGRNVGDEYFGAGSPLSYRDYDLIAIGPVVEELAQSFNTFWHSGWSYPLDSLPTKANEIDWADVQGAIRAQISASELLATDYSVEPEDWSALIGEAKERLDTGRARAVFDCPPSLEDKQFPVLTAHTLNKVAAMAEQTVIIISPYVVPLESLRAHFRQLSTNGLDITIYTNSLAATDHTYAFSGYAKHRAELLEMGINLREVKPDAAISSIHQVSSSPADHIALHGKLSVFDQRWVYVGSFNLDPRSAFWNTELGILVDSPEFAEQVLADFAPDLDDDSSWRVELRREDGKKKGRIVWLSGDEESTSEPSRGKSQKISNWFYSLFKLDEQL